MFGYNEAVARPRSKRNLEEFAHRAVISLVRRVILKRTTAYLGREVVLDCFFEGLRGS